MKKDRVVERSVKYYLSTDGGQSEFAKGFDSIKELEVFMNGKWKDWALSRGHKKVQIIERKCRAEIVKEVILYL